ncbi:MAG: IS1634 family transposase, partial [Pseudomonadota bacterium]
TKLHALLYFFIYIIILFVSSLAMRTRNGNLHLEIQTSRKSPVGILRTSFRDKQTGSIRHTQHGRITGCTLEQLKMLQLAFREKVLPADSPAAFRILQSKEYGASRVLLELTKSLGLHRILYSRTEPWVQSALAMIVGRILYQGSKLALCNQSANTTLWEQCGIQGRPEVNEHCYEPLDCLLQRQTVIQRQLATKHLSNGCLVLYDITSTYFEGEYSESRIVRFGYNRDKKKGHKQVVMGLLCSREGCPVGCEIFPGNTNDATTVTGKIEELREQYGLEKIIFVGDRGMVTSSQLEKLQGVEGLNTISALTHAEITNLLKNEVIQMELFDEREIVEVVDPDKPTERYCLCRNPVSQQKEDRTRNALLDKTAEGLNKIAAYKQRVTTEVLASRIGKLFSKTKMEKFVRWEIQCDPLNERSNQHKVIWSWNEEKLASERLLDGCYIIRTDVASERLGKEEVVNCYKTLGEVERAFRSLKTVHLEMRPVYHKKDDRIRAHLFMCVLAYYVQWHLVERLRPIFASDGDGENRRWTVQNALERLKQITSNTVESQGIQFEQISELTPEQQTILNHLNLSL